MKISFIAFLLVLFTASESQARTKLVTASCEMGSGCSFQLSDNPPSEFDVVYGTDAGYHEALPENAILVDAKIEGNWEHYVETGMSRSELDKFFGGDGFTQLQVFNPWFQPLNGEWRVQIGTVTGDICYGQESNLFKSMLQGITAKGNLTFLRPFHARTLLNSPEVKWRRITPDRYSGYLGNQYMNLRFNVQLITERKIEGSFVVTIKVPTKPVCVNRIPVTYTLVKAAEGPDLPGEPSQPDVPILEDGPRPDVPLLEENSKPTVPLIEDGPKPNVPLLEEKTKPSVPIIKE